MRKPLLFLCLLLLPLLGYSQQKADSIRIPPMRHVEMADVEIVPEAVNGRGWLLLNQDIQLELDGAVHNLYNFKFDRAEKQFRSLRRRYPQHPMPYFLLGLSTWWKMVPSNARDTRYDKVFLAYMDTAIVYGERQFDADDANYEAAFFLSAAYGFDARLNAERHNWRRAILSSKRALNYLKISQEANSLSPEFLFGQALMNYYAVWINEKYPLLRPVLLFFPKGNRKLGLEQLRHVATNGFYTSGEAKFFLLKILYNDEEDLPGAWKLARQLTTEYPDNAYFQRFYNLVCFRTQKMAECERVSQDILDKINRGMPGYEGISGKYAAYMMGAIMQGKYRDADKAKEYFQRCIVFAEMADDTKGGFYVSANANLASMALLDKDVPAARRYYQVVLAKADPDSDAYKQAKSFLKSSKS
ncbi:tol-pal system protein YbgF [Hymenobacter sp. DG25B]|uniref:Tol-Pal system protein YbgF n=1 Tax=Hymenobacter sp. DG25B TaxID=1385664 RepID=UPI0005410991|nr:Tol-Pal system protein YbgF [Hymenobacter sp. DG25B]AIZ63833.1 tol-pal system protein YbgF [Hymenobacter sp. DG25B]